MSRRTGHHHARKVAVAAVAAVAAFGLTACQDTSDGASGAASSAASQDSGSPDASAKSGAAGDAAESLRKTAPTPLRDGAGLYPRAIRLEHSGKDNGRVLASTVVPGGGNGIGAVQESTDGGASFSQVGTIADPASADGRGLCCATLYELPRQVGDMPAGTLLWAASFGQDVPKADRHMSIRVFKSTDVGRSWTYLSTVATATDTKGLWEPEFSIDAEGNLVCHYSDETDPRHSQKLVAVRSRDGVSWSGLHDTVASAPASDRPGMAVVRKLPNGTYVMTYEICSDDPKFSCVVHYRTSPDGWDWGDPTNLGIRPQTADGKYFKHAPTLAWAPEAGNPQGKLLLVGQAMFNADGSKAEGSGRTIWTNSKGGEGTWKEIPAPVAVTSDKVDFCPNYSSSLLPSADGHQLLEIATDYDGGVCRPFHATDGM
ncbi:sialidase family protein [Streptomyces sp. 5-10]|uniref:sialidase family protein n=1 Tax=Streptomyces sp. 5-10 TaxID=878925 RepID=UPI00168BC1A8|nr:sialidase family protein [Streptomyces sp. 5-10]MBD3003042.1 exo-alpha-sialidase [Streptomyces sp. 5-10]